MQLISRVVLVLILSLVLAGFVLQPAPKTPAQLYAQYNTAITVVNIAAGEKRGHGTAFYLGGNIWATAGHVAMVPDANYEILGRPAAVLAVDSLHDVAIMFGVAPSSGIRISLCNEFDIVAPGTPVTLIGYPLSLTSVASIAQGIVGNQYEFRGPGIVDLIASMNSYPGNSGSPVFTEAGCAVGVLSYVIVARDGTLANGLSGVMLSKHVRALLREAQP